MSNRLSRIEARLDQQLAAMRDAGECFKKMKSSLSQIEFEQACKENGYDMEMIEVLIHIFEFGLTRFAATRLVEFASKSKD